MAFKAKENDNVVVIDEWKVVEVTIEKKPEEERFGLRIKRHDYESTHESPFKWVFKVTPDSAAFRNRKIRPGDLLMKVNDVNCFSVPYNVILDEFKQTGNSVRLKVRRLSLKSRLLKSPAVVNKNCFRYEIVDSEKLIQEHSRDALDDYNADMFKLFDKGRFTDFTIRTGNGQERVIRAHRAILSARSRYFDALFSMGGAEAKSGEIEVPEPYETMVELIRFFYTGKWFARKSVEGRDHDGFFELLIAADKYQVDRIKIPVECMLLSMNNVCDTLVEAIFRNHLELKTKAADFIRVNYRKVWDTDGWSRLCRDHPDLVASVFFPTAKSNQST